MLYLAEVTHPRYPNIVVNKATSVRDIPSATSRIPTPKGQAATILAVAQTKTSLVPHVHWNAVSSRKSTYLEGQYI